MKIHVVQKGDTLWKIAQKYGVNFEQLKEMNTQLSNPDMIMPGMKIKVPADSKPVKKEYAKKEQPKYPSEHPYKDTSPKPLPVIKEEKKTAPKEMPKPKEQPKMEKPMMPMMPKMPQPNITMPISMQFPTMEQQMQNHYTTVNLPQMPVQPKEEPKEKPAEAVKGVSEQPQQMPMPEQPVYYYYTMPCLPCPPHPCHPCHPYMMPYHGYYDQQQMMPYGYGMEESSDEGMQNQVAGAYQGQAGDCGCNDPYGGYGGHMMQQPYGYPSYGMMPQQGMMPGQMNNGNPMFDQQGQMGQMMPGGNNMGGFDPSQQGGNGMNPFGAFNMPRFEEDE
ncbi:spore coat protein [Pontibacillus halophilus JSM 076056 = DSM 19796]|uniref:Spore coat protein n=1 Tax=Pontibacillus halophilus JSM 076056 = DSM 19796 TaxID=1385510 RepID=A0A0A5GQT5_9BACI|nr:SafA/ExsA family spore coat assembly protein [Pontibacillus halophilus]KGX93495.1 spore coat protein [Pontibacillus halophilus JSM 076056 = DSM 19796]